MVNIEELRLVGMDANLDDIPYGSGYPICYHPELEGGYCLIHPPSNYFSFKQFKRLPDESIVIAPLIEYYESDWAGAAASSAVWTNYSSSDIPQMCSRLEKDIIMKSPDNNCFFWLTEPKKYIVGMRRISFLRKDIVDLLRTSDKTQFEALFCGIAVYEELNKKGLLLWGATEEIERKKAEWEKYVLKSYDAILAKFLETGEEKERIKQLSDGVLLFCNEDQARLRRLLAYEGTDFQHSLERIAAIYYDGNSNAVQKDLDRLKQKLKGE